MDIEGKPEDQRRAVLKTLEAHPGLATAASGTLAGPASSGRPDIPIWECERYVADHPDSTLEELIQVRLPVVFFGGEEFTITSVAEELRNCATPPHTPITVSSVIDRWGRLHAACVVRWDSARRAVEHVRSIDAYRTIITERGASQQSPREHSTNSTQLTASAVQHDEPAARWEIGSRARFQSPL